MPLSRKKFLQQTGFACASTMLPFSKLFSAELRKPLTVDTSHPKACSQDLTNTLFPDSFVIKEVTFDYHKGTYPGIAKDVLYKKEEDVDDCVDKSTFGDKYCGFTNHHNPISNDLCELKYTAFYPISTYAGEDPTNGHDYNQVPLPLILLFHPGGFAECGERVPTGIRTLCEQFAKRGFIAIAAGYRLGRARDPNGIPIGDVRISVQQQMAPYRGIQDGKGAIRSIFKRNGLTDRGGHNFKINPNQFFIGGASAGAVIAMGVTYYRNQAMINQAFPVTTTSLTIQEALGHINEDFYFGEPFTETEGSLDAPLYTPPIRAILNCWGGISIPKSFDENATYPNPDLGKVEKGYFQAIGSEDPDLVNPPMIGFIGANDTTIPFKDDEDFQNVKNSSVNYYRKEDFCLASTTGFIMTKAIGTGPMPNIYTKVCSANNIYYILKELNRFTELYIDCDMAHGLNDGDDNFDVYPATEANVFTYIAKRAAIFFQTCMNYLPYPPFGYRGKSLFISTNYDTNINVINERICADNCTTNTTTCSTGNDTPCENF